LACRGGDWLRQKATQTFFLTPDLPFGFEIGKIVKNAGLNSDQLDLILGKNLARPLASSPNRLPRKPWTSCKSDYEKSDVSSVGAEKWIGLSVTRQ